MPRFDTKESPTLLDGNRWNDSLLWEHFVPMDVASILRIHLPSTPRVDEVL